MGVHTILLTTLALCATLGMGGLIKFKDCPAGSKGAPPGGNKIVVDSLSIQGCDKEPCNFIMSEKYTLDINATINYSSKKLIYSIIAILPNDYQVPVVDNDNLCDYLTHGSCNGMTTGTKLGLSRSISVQNVPVYQGPCRTVIKDDNGVSQFCGDFNINVQPNLNFPKFGR